MASQLIIRRRATRSTLRACGETSAIRTPPNRDRGLEQGLSVAATRDPALHYQRPAKQTPAKIIRQQPVTAVGVPIYRRHQLRQ
jgi:hypothetical protein